MPGGKDLSGQTFGQLTVLRHRGVTKAGKWQFDCLCTCGREVNVIGGNLKAGGATKCMSCARRHAATVHGGFKSPEWQTWRGMISRCRDSTHKNFDDYGGRGIIVCERWKNFSTFLSDMGPKPSAEHTVERNNNDGNYEPGNCRWATRKEQARNKRKRRWRRRPHEPHAVTP